MVEAKLIISQQCALITSGENCVRGYGRNAVSKVREVVMPQDSEMVRLHLKYCSRL